MSSKLLEFVRKVREAQGNANVARFDGALSNNITTRADHLKLRALYFLGIAGLFLCLALRDLRLGAQIENMPQFVQIRFFPWAVFAVAVWRVHRSDRFASATGKHVLALLAIALSCIPLAAEFSRGGIGLAIGALGLFLLLHSGKDKELHAAAVCLLALCANLSVAPLVFLILYKHVIGVDMYLLQKAIDIAGAPVVATPAGFVAADGMRVMLVGACSSFMGVSIAVLVHMGWAMAIRTETSWRDVVAVAATVCVATFLNVIRLTLTASGYDGYAFWHGAVGETPVGGQIFWFAQNLVLLTGGYISATWAARPHKAGAVT